jgi:transposase
VPIAVETLRRLTLYHRRDKIENRFGKLKDWRRVHTCMTDAPTFMSAILIAATIIFWL